MTEYEKMLGGEIYNAVDPSLLKGRMFGTMLGIQSDKAYRFQGKE